jgi:hypothetical protein
MVRRCILLLAFAAVLQLTPSVAAAVQAPPAPPEFASKLTIYLAKGAADACGPGCDRWIAVEGAVDGDAAARVRKFLRDVKDIRLPFYFHSQGGQVPQAFAIGRMLRSRKAIGRVGQTIAAACSGSQVDDACLKIKTAGGEVEARITTRRAMCNSACGYLFLGATTREVAPDAAIVVHNSKLTLQFRGHATARQRAEVRAGVLDRSERERSAFVAAMGISHELIDLIDTVKFESFHFLTRPELYRFKIDTRAAIETVWTLETSPSVLLRKSALTGSADGLTFRKAEWWLSCAGRDRVRLTFLREGDGVASSKATVAMTGPDRPPAFALRPARVGTFDAWNAFLSADDVKRLSAVSRLHIDETAGAAEGEAKRTSFEIATAGLESLWPQLSAACSNLPVSPRMATFPTPAPAIVPIPVPVPVAEPEAASKDRP